MGDMNIDSTRWGQPDHTLTPRDKEQKKLLSILTEEILSKGTIKLNKEPTRFSNYQNPSCLDHAYATNPEKITTTNTINTTGSDHSIILIEKSLKNPIGRSKYYYKRNYKNIDYQLLENSIILNPKYLTCLTHLNVSWLNRNIKGKNKVLTCPNVLFKEKN